MKRRLIGKQGERKFDAMKNESYETLVQPCFRVYFLGGKIPSNSSAYTKLF